MDLKFCENCNNLMDFCLENSDDDLQPGKPVYICSRCSNKQKTNVQDIYIASDKVFEKKNILNKNEYLILDPTIPHITNKNIKCINLECESHSTKKSNIKYIKYDEENLKYMYICTHCSQKWTNTIN